MTKNKKKGKKKNRQCITKTWLSRETHNSIKLRQRGAPCACTVGLKTSQKKNENKKERENEFASHWHGMRIRVEIVMYIGIATYKYDGILISAPLVSLSNVKCFAKVTLRPPNCQLSTEDLFLVFRFFSPVSFSFFPQSQSRSE